MYLSVNLKLTVACQMTAASWGINILYRSPYVRIHLEGVAFGAATSFA